MGSQKGQAMMEYLVSYGWALLALLLVLAVLVSSGIFSPSSFTSQECVFQPGLPCNSFILYKDSSSGQTYLKFSLSNGLGFPINITEVNYTVIDIGVQGRREVVGNIPVPSAIQPGASTNFSQNFSGPFQPQPKSFRTVFVHLSYLNCKNAACSGPYEVSGKISSLVEGG
ncbi:MAG: hypothetical protein N3G80_00585 [Candidatus Micrarchaeota archaeon]|nr:hypothetical protein [Candidatus Micrarchaeota archaeon]